MDPQVPLVVPEVNSRDIAGHRGIIANPNCSTIQMVVALKPLHDAARVRRVVVSTYQSVSGAGQKGIHELESQMAAHVHHAKTPPPSKFAHPILDNCIPQIDDFVPGGYTKEEIKMVNETRKIMGDPTIDVSPTCVRVPVTLSHSESILIETERPISASDARRILSSAPGVTVVDDPLTLSYPLAASAAGQDDVFVGRIREDLHRANTLLFWCVSDNLRKAQRPTPCRSPRSGSRWSQTRGDRGTMRNIKLTLSYDGTDFHGWQRQPGLRTIQGVLEEAIVQLTGTAAATNASGRTDAGVHAAGQVVHFFTPARHSTETILRALNAHLPRDIRILNAEDRPQAFHSTLDAKSKRYRYTIDNSAIPDVFFLRYRWHVHTRLDDRAMARAGACLLGRHDFRSFETEWPNRTSSVRTIYALSVERSGSAVTIEVEADGFLYNMVRSIAGTLVFVGSGKRAEAWVAEVLAGENRVLAGPTAPAKGLCLVRVNYGDSPETE